MIYMEGVAGQISLTVFATELSAFLGVEISVESELLLINISQNIAIIIDTLVISNR